MGRGTWGPAEAAVDAGKLVRALQARGLAMVGVGVVALVIASVRGEDGGPWWSFIVVMALWAMPAVQLYRSAAQLRDGLPHLPVRPARSLAARRGWMALVVLTVILSIGLLATEPQASGVLVALGVASGILLRRVEAAMRRHPGRHLVVATTYARFLPLVTYTWGEAEGSEAVRP